MTVKDPKRLASEVRFYLKSAVADAASGIIDFPDLADDALRKKIRKAKKDGVRDLRGWLADELYNDPDTLQDILGDHICDLTNGDDALYNLVLDELEEQAHDALKKATKALYHK